ncbi:MAG: oligosaccharide flippase family protein, partial [Pseudomonas sp.]
IVVSVPGSFRMAYLRGKKKFGSNSWAGLIGSGAKLLLSVLFVLAGWGVSGAIAGLVLAQLVSFLYSGRKARQAGFGPSLRGSFWRLPDFRLIMPELKYAGLVLAASLSITALYSIDIIAVKHYFDAETAGLYAGIATVARIIFFVTASIPQVLLPSVRLGDAPGKSRRTLQYSALLLVGIGGAVLAVFWLLPELVVRLLMGGSYTEFAYLLPRLGLVIFVVSVLNLVLQYYLALRRYPVGFIAIIGLAVTCGLVVANHSSPQAIVDSMLYGSLVSLGVLAVWAGVTGNNSKGEIQHAT